MALFQAWLRMILEQWVRFFIKILVIFNQYLVAGLTWVTQCQIMEQKRKISLYLYLTYRQHSLSQKNPILISLYAIIQLDFHFALIFTCLLSQTLKQTFLYTSLWNITIKVKLMITFLLMKLLSLGIFDTESIIHLISSKNGKNGSNRMKQN